MSAPTRETAFTSRVVDEVQRIASSPLSSTDTARATAALIDHLAVLMAGLDEDSARITRAVARAEGGAPRATIVGTSTRTSISQAALCNAIAAHALDLDDSSAILKGHPTAVVMPAVLAVGEAVAASGRRMLTAYAAGVQAMSLVAAATDETSYARGFHGTGVNGPFGSAAAAAVLLGLDDDGLARALGLAATQAAGLKAVFGTMGKHLNAGRAAANGVFAALAAQGGFTAPLDAVEAERGYSATHSDALDLDRVDDLLADRSGMDGVVAKRHACCHGTHSAAETITAIRARRPFTDDEVVSVVLHARPIVPTTCDIVAPRTGLEGKFSIRYVAALALAGEPTTQEGFTDEKVRDPRLVALRDRVDVVVQDGLDVGGTVVTVEFADGTVITDSVNAVTTVDDAGLDAHLGQLEAKFLDLVEPVVGAGRARGALAAVEAFDRADGPGEILGLLDAGR